MSSLPPPSERPPPERPPPERPGAATPTESTPAADSPAADAPAPAPAPSRRRCILRRTRRWSLRALLASLAFTALYFLAVWILGNIAVNTDRVPPTEGVEVYVWSNGLHVDLLVPAKHRVMDWTTFAPHAADRAPAPYLTHVLLGWGDRDFYIHTRTTEDFALGITLKAVFLPSASAMHVAWRSFVPVPAENCVRVVLRDEEYARLVQHLKSGFALDANGKPQRLAGQSHHEHDAFFVGAGSYHLFNTCNNWANRALKRAGVRTAAWSPMDYAMLARAREK